MDKPKIYLSLTDDWELRGNGSGDLNEIQIRPMQKLIEIYGKYGARGTFMAEVMQQLTFRREQRRFPELKTLADSWDEAVRGAFKQRHDIQLHIHPQWTKAEYANGKWKLSGDWSILNYPEKAADEMISACKNYLENLLRPINPEYKCVAFRAGASVIAPSPFILNLLAKHGIVFDLSIVGGLRVNTRNVKFDYTDCDEDFLPFYPRMDDARKISDKTEPVICVPIFQFYGSRRRFVRQIFSKALKKAGQKVAPASQKTEIAGYSKQEWAEIGKSSLLARVFDKVIVPTVKGKHLVADTGQLDYFFLREMLRAIRKKARASKLEKIPVILTNHSKYIEDFAPIEKFLQELSEADDIEFITLSEMAEKLRAGEFQINKAGAAV